MNSRAATFSGRVFQLARRANGHLIGHRLPGTRLRAFAVSPTERRLIGETVANRDGEYVLHMLHLFGDGDEDNPARSQLVIVADYEGHEWSQLEFGPVSSLQGSVSGTNIIYDVPDDGPAIFDPDNTFEQPWHALMHRLAEDCGLVIDDIEFDFDVDRPFEELSNEERRTIAAAVFRRRIAGPEDVDWFTAQLVEVLTPGKTPEEVEQDRLAEQALRHALDCCDDCDISIPVELPPWDITVPKLPASVSQLLGTDALSGFQQGRPLSGRVYLP